MFTNRLPYLFVVVSLLLLTSCSSKATPDPKQALIGTWTSTVTKEDILRILPDFEKKSLCDVTGTIVWKFNTNGRYIIDQTPLSDCPAIAFENSHQESTWSVDGNEITLSQGDPDHQEIYEFTVNTDHLIFIKAKSSKCIRCIAVFTANPWVRVT